MYHQTMEKLFVAKVDFDPKLGKKQKIAVLLDSNFECPEKTQENTFDIGLSFYETPSTKYFFASCEQAPEGAEYVPIDSLDKDNCPDYEAIEAAIKKLGYER